MSNMMPAGRYYVGDLCYVMHPEWDEACDHFFAGRNDGGCNDGVFILKDGRRYAAFSTMYGDGTYNDQLGHSYSVDAGLIGCIRVEDIRDETYDNLLDLGAIVEFSEPFEVSGGRGTEGWDGMIKIGFLEIATGDEYDEDEEDYDESEVY